jgi:hypothetical protein
MKRTITFAIIFLTFAMAVVTAQGKIDKKAIAEGLKSHDRALYIKEGWIRDPYIYLTPDGYYYHCGTVPNPTGLPKPNRPGTTVPSLNHNAYGGFLSLRLGLYATGEGTVTFRNFKYKKLNKTK